MQMIRCSPSSLLCLQALILGKSAGLLQGSCSSVVRAPTTKVGDLGFDSPVAAHAFFLCPNLPPVA